MAVTTAAAVPSAGAATPNGFVVPGYDIQVALAGDRLFESGKDLQDSSVHVFDLSGHQLAAITGEPDVQVLEASPDGSRLFAGLGASRTVSVIDTASLTELARYDISTLGIPTHVAQDGNRLFVGGYSRDTGVQVGVLDLSRPDSVPTAIISGSNYLAVSKRTTTITLHSASAGKDLMIDGLAVLRS